MKQTKNISLLVITAVIIFAGILSVSKAQTIDSGITEFGMEAVLQNDIQLPTLNKKQLFNKNPIITKDNIASLRFVWNAPVNIAAFKRNDKIWMVFDKPNRVDVAALKKEAKHLAKEIYTLPHPGGTIVVVVPAPGVKHSLRKEGLLWILDLYTGRPPNFKVQNMTIFTQYDSLKNSYIFIPTNYAGNVLSFLDPEIGDIISVATTSQLGLGFDSSYRYPDFDILETSQGLAFIVNAPDIMLNRGNSGITLKALGRSLNITHDLDALKRNQRYKASDTEASHINAFSLQIPQKLTTQNISDVVEDFKKQILTAPNDQKNLLRLKLAQYYIYNGLGTNALYILNQMQDLDLPETKTDRFYALSGIANFLARRYKQAVKNFSEGTILNTEEGVFWKTIAQSASEYKEENNKIIFAHISLMRDYPQAIKDEVAIIAARHAIATNDDLSSQNFIDILRAVSDRLRNLTPQITYLTAQKLEMQGYLRNAIKEYSKLLNSDSTMFSAYARFHHTVLSQMINFIDVQTAITELEKLRYAWGEKSFKIRLLNKLADFYLKNKDYYNALRVLNEEGFITEGEQKTGIAKKMVKIFEDIFIGNHADETLSPIKSLALYQDFKWVSALSPKQNMIIQKLADRLVAVDLLPRAQELLMTLLQKDDLTPNNYARIGSRLAVIYLFEKKPQEALDILEATDSPFLTPETINPRRIIASRALSALNRPEEALELLEDDNSPNSIMHKFEIYWNAGDWDNASNTIKQMIEEPTPGKPLSVEQINYILDWATTLKQAGKETVLVRLRNKFAPYFKNTPYQSAFNVLTNHLEKEKISIKDIKTIINDTKNFNDFAKFYTKTLEEHSEEKPNEETNTPENE